MINILSTFWIFNILSLLISSSSNLIINRIFLVHFSLGFLIASILFLHLFLLHSFSSSNSLFNVSSSLFIPFFSLYFNDLFITFIFFSFSFSYFLFLPDLIGNSDNLIFANLLFTPNHILPE